VIQHHNIHVGKKKSNLTIITHEHVSISSLQQQISHEDKNIQTDDNDGINHRRNSYEETLLKEKTNNE